MSDALDRALRDAYAAGKNGDEFDMLAARARVTHAPATSSDDGAEPYRCDFCGSDYSSRACCQQRYEYLAAHGVKVAPPDIRSIARDEQGRPLAFWGGLAAKPAAQVWRSRARALLHRLFTVQPPNVLLQQLEMLGEARDLLSAALDGPEPPTAAKTPTRLPVPVPGVGILFADIPTAAAAPLEGLDFEPDEHHTVEDMANVGYSLMQAIARHMPDYAWNESPAEIVCDLINERDEAAAKPAAQEGVVSGAALWETYGDEYCGPGKVSWATLDAENRAKWQRIADALNTRLSRHVAQPVGEVDEVRRPFGWVKIDNRRATIEFTNVWHVAEEWQRDTSLIVERLYTAARLPAGVVDGAMAAKAEAARVKSLNAIVAYGSMGIDESHNRAMKDALIAVLTPNDQVKP